MCLFQNSIKINFKINFKILKFNKIRSRKNDIYFYFYLK